MCLLQEQSESASFNSVSSLKYFTVSQISKLFLISTHIIIYDSIFSSTTITTKKNMKEELEMHRHKVENISFVFVK